MHFPILRRSRCARAVAVSAVAAFTFVAARPQSGRAQEPVPVRVVMPEPSAAAATLRLTGTVTAERRAGLSPRLSGLVAAVLVDAGDHVERSHVLLELDRELAEIALARAEAALAEARSNLAEARRLQSESAQLIAQRHIAESEALARDADVRQNTAVAAKTTKAHEPSPPNPLLLPAFNLLSPRHGRGQCAGCGA